MQNREKKNEYIFYSGKKKKAHEPEMKQHFEWAGSRHSRPRPSTHPRVSLTVSERTSTSHPPLYRTASEIEMVFFDYVFTKEERKRSLSYLFSLVRRAQTKYDEEEEKGKKIKYILYDDKRKRKQDKHQQLLYRMRKGQEGDCLPRILYIGLSFSKQFFQTQPTTREACLVVDQRRTG